MYMQMYGIANIGLDDSMLVGFTVQFILFSCKVSLYFDLCWFQLEFMKSSIVLVDIYVQ